MSNKYLHIILFLIIFTFSNLSAKEPIKVLFLNPGESTERGSGNFWLMVTDFMEEAATDLNIELEVIYSDRNHIKMKKQAEEVVQRKSHPDYIIIVNEKSSAPFMLKELAPLDSKIIVMHNTLTEKQRKKTGNEREHFINWIGTVTSNDEHAGYVLAQELSNHIEEKPEVIAITGDRGTPVSFERVVGLRDFLSIHKGNLLQIYHSNWSSNGGYEKASSISRYPKTNMFWAANDAMALGVLKKLKERGLEDKIVVGGTGAFPEAIKSIENGELKTTIGGHTMIGAWTLVILYDYHHGIDFIRNRNASVELSTFFVVNKDNVEEYRENIEKDSALINFKDFTRLHNNNLGQYDFSYNQILKNINKYR